MKLYNVEIFDRSLAYVSNTLCSEVNRKEDYLDPEKYTVELVGTKVDIGNLIHFQGEDSFIGIISKFEEKESGVTKVTVEELGSLMDRDYIEDVSAIGTGSFEDYIKAKLLGFFVNGDAQEALPITITTSTETTGWMIDFKVKNEPKEDEPAPPVVVTELNLLDDVIIPAFTQYQIRLEYGIDLNNRSITINVGKNEAPEIVIEADLKNIIEKNLVIKKANKQTNKVIAYNKKDYTEKITYYLHPDETFDTSDTDRVTPVYTKIIEAQEELEDEQVVKTFEEDAEEKAATAFEKNKYTNLIELTVLNDDSLIKPYDLKVGQRVRVISEGISYSSILTGREVKNSTKLIFGTIRLELTKILKGRA